MSWLQVTDSTFTKNDVDWGGAVYAEFVNVVAKRSNFTENDVSEGGAIYVYYVDWMQASDCIFNGNTADVSLAHKFQATPLRSSAAC